MDNRNSYSKRYSSGADAFANPASNPNRYSQQQRQLDQQRASMYSNNGMTPSSSAGAAATRPGAPAAAGARANAWAPVADEDEDDEDEDHWNVYDDFNNARPTAGAPGSPVGAQNPYAHPSDPSRTSFGSGGPNSPGATGTGFVAQPPPSAIPRSGTGATLSAMTGGQRQSLLPREAFGFDVQNSDPRGIRVDPYGSPGGEFTPSSNTDGMGAFLNEKRGSGYQNLNAIEAAIMPAGHDRSNNTTGIELVTVPALGTEFSRAEMKGMARKQKRRAHIAKRRRKMGKWASGEEKVFGLFDRRMVMIASFVFLVLLALTLYFVIPRVPSVGFLTANPLTAVPDASGMSIGGPPANFSMLVPEHMRILPT
ncbi:hypothetical protein CF326_g1303 [Tilletia indica]|nr:hypothetical protein CF326_g1303 [Tilletia indica]